MAEFPPIGADSPFERRYARLIDIRQLNVMRFMLVPTVQLVDLPAERAKNKPQYFKYLLMPYSC